MGKLLNMGYSKTVEKSEEIRGIERKYMNGLEHQESYLI